MSEWAEEIQASGQTEGSVVLVDQLPYRMVRPFRVRFEEATADETVRSAIYLAWVADIAWQHSTALGFGREWYSARGLFWLVRAVKLDVLAPIHTYEEVLVSTRVAAYRRIGARRESEVRDRSGRLLARLDIDWVMVNERGIPTRVPDDFHKFVVDGAVTFEMHKVAPLVAPPNAVERRFDVRRRDLDPLDHVNNSVYLDYFEEALEAAGQGDLLAATPRRYVLDFANSAERDEALVSRTWPHEDGWAYSLTRTDGSEIFRARLARI
jgi:acyl-CoA thioesterase FadM